MVAGGELPAMVLIEALVRFLPGVPSVLQDSYRMSPVLINIWEDIFGDSPVPNISLRLNRPPRFVRTGIQARCIKTTTSVQMDDQFTIKRTLIYQSTI